MSAAEQAEVNPELTCELRGVEFRLAGPPSPMAMLELAALADGGGLDTEDREALAAILNLIRDLIHEDDWGAFRRHARRERVTGEELMLDFAKRACEVVLANPTKRSSASSDGRPATGSRSRAASSARAIEPELKSPAELVAEANLRGRPDIAQIIRMRHPELQPA